MASSRGFAPFFLCVLSVIQWNGLADCQIQNSQIDVVTVDTLNGPVRGKEITVQISGYSSRFPIRQFLGIPFATPPTGSLRFQPPKPVENWHSVRDALEFGPSCIQDLSSEQVPGAMSEDCLTLNIYAPVNNVSTEIKYPVMVWIYGGSYRDGSSVLYNGSALAALGEVVVVTLNYRLGAFGFLTSTTFDRVAGNMGILDQQLALKWVNLNIESFGGDMERITIFGESAGAGSVNMHLLSPGSKGLYHRAIAESGSSLSGWAVQDSRDLTLSAQVLAQATSCLSGVYVDVNCLRNVTAKDLLEAQDKVYKYFAQTVRQLPFTPAVDGDVIPMTPLKALQTGNFNPVNLLSGVNHDEASLFLLKFFPGNDAPTVNVSSFNAYVERAVGLGFHGFPPAGSNKIVQDVVKFEYTDWSDPNDGQLRLQATIQVSTDFDFVCPLQLQADYWSQAGGKLYMYEFSHTTGIFPSWAGVPHSSEIVFVFGLVLEAEELPTYRVTPKLYTVTEADRQVSRDMISMWAQFAHTGDPSMGIPSSSSLMSWPIFNSTTRRYVNINTAITEGGYLHGQRCQLLGSVSQTLFKDCATPSTTAAPSPTSAASTTNPIPILQCSSSKPLLYGVVILAVILAMALSEIVFLAYRLRATRATDMPEARKALLND